MRPDWTGETTAFTYLIALVRFVMYLQCSFIVRDVGIYLYYCVRQFCQLLFYIPSKTPEPSPTLHGTYR